MKANIMTAQNHHQLPAVDLVANAFTLVFIPAEVLAQRFGFGVDEAGLKAFKSWTSRVGIRTAPKRPGFYDPKAVRERLDAFHQTTPEHDAGPAVPSEEPVNLTEQRRLRNAEKGK